MIEVCAIPGGSARTSIGVAMKLKLDGVRAGVYDLMLLWKGAKVAFIEGKATKGSTTGAQDEFGEFLTATGHRGCVCRRLSEVIEFLTDCGVKLL